VAAVLGRGLTPFAVGMSRSRAIRQVIVGVALLAVGVGLVVAGGGIVALVAALAGVAATSVGLVSLRQREPVLRADAEGVSMQAFKGPGGVRRLAWSEVEAVYVHRIGRQFRMLCVLPRDLEAERAWAGEQRAASLDGSVKRVGAPYSVNLVPAGLQDAEALAALRALGAPVRN
jgi:hypothetical protein